MLAAVTAVAQEKMKDSPKSSHEGMAKAGWPLIGVCGDPAADASDFF